MEPILLMPQRHIKTVNTFLGPTTEPCKEKMKNKSKGPIFESLVSSRSVAFLVLCSAALFSSAVVVLYQHCFEADLNRSVLQSCSSPFYLLSGLDLVTFNGKDNWTFFQSKYKFRTIFCFYTWLNQQNSKTLNNRQIWIDKPFWKEARTAPLKCFATKLNASNFAQTIFAPKFQVVRLHLVPILWSTCEVATSIHEKCVQLFANVNRGMFLHKIFKKCRKYCLNVLSCRRYVLEFRRT